MLIKNNWDRLLKSLIKLKLLLGSQFTSLNLGWTKGSVDGVGSLLNKSNTRIESNGEVYSSKRLNGRYLNKLFSIHEFIIVEAH